MRTPFDQSISRIKKRRAENPEYQNTVRQLGALSTDLNSVQQSVNARIGRTGESINAQIGAMVAQNQSISSIYNRVYGDAQQEKNQRMDALDNQLLSLESQRDNFVFQKEQEEKVRKQGMWKTLATVGGTVLGGAVGSFVPGLGTMLGAQLGSALGGIVGNSGIKGTGPADANAILQNVGEVTAAAGKWASNNTNRQVMKDVGDFMSGKFTHMSYDRMTEDQRVAFKYMQETNNIDGLYDMMGILKRPGRRWSGNFGG